MELFIFARFQARPGNEAPIARHASLPHTLRFLDRVEPLIDHAHDIVRSEQIV